jgi:F-type H+-transporting ATPase subunit alpha
MEAAIIFAAVNGYFDSFEPSQTSAAEVHAQDFLQREAKEVLQKISESKNIDEETETLLRAALDTFAKRTSSPHIA